MDDELGDSLLLHPSITPVVFIEVYNYLEPSKAKVAKYQDKLNFEILGRIIAYFLGSLRSFEAFSEASLIRLQILKNNRQIILFGSAVTYQVRYLLYFEPALYPFEVVSHCECYPCNRSAVQSQRHWSRYKH